MFIGTQEDEDRLLRFMSAAGHLHRGHSCRFPTQNARVALSSNEVSGRRVYSWTGRDSCMRMNESILLSLPV